MLNESRKLSNCIENTSGKMAKISIAIVNLVKQGQLCQHVVVVSEVDDSGPDPLGEAVQVSVDHGEAIVHHYDRAPVASVPDTTAKSLKLFKCQYIQHFVKMWPLNIFEFETPQLTDNDPNPILCPTIHRGLGIRTGTVIERPPL